MICLILGFLTTAPIVITIFIMKVIFYIMLAIAEEILKFVFYTIVVILSALFKPRNKKI